MRNLTRQVEDKSKLQQMAAAGRFSAVDYVVFALMLLISAVIGVYYGFFGSKQKTTKEYLLADRSMPSWPVAVSLLASYLSAITLLGAPSEVYTYGSQYMVLVFFSYWIFCFAVAVVFIPVFYRTHIVSVNEYLEIRFSPGVRVFGCILFILEYLLYMSVVLYAPSLALEAVAGVPLAASIISTGVVCTFYTTLGGLKAVVWTDVFQTSVMVIGLATVCITGSIHVGGMDKVFKIAKGRDRLTVFDFNPDPTVRNTFWTLSIGAAFTAMPVWTVSQTAVQRFLAVKSLKAAKTAIWMNIPFLIIVVFLCCLDGLVIFAVYADCDLATNGEVRSNDQVLPYFVVDMLGHLKGVPGVFTACLFAGALSTASSGLNSLALVILEDIVKKRMRNITDQEAAKICKLIAVTFGGLVIGGAFLVQYAGTMVLQLAYSIFGILGGPLLGVFSLGIFFRRANWRGAYCGIASGMLITAWIFIGAYLYPPDKHPAPISIQGCPSFNQTLAKFNNDTGIRYPVSPSHDHALAKFYSISYLWYSAIGVFTTVLVGAVMSIILGHFLDTEEAKSRELDPKLIFDWGEWFRSLFPSKVRRRTYTVEEAVREEILLEDKE